MNATERVMLIEEAASAWRPRTPDGATLAHPAWADLDPAARQDAYEAALVMRVLEAALDREEYSTTVRAVVEALARP